MSDRPFTLRIVSPEQIVAEVEVQSVRFPGEDGSFGVLKNHASMVALSESGLLSATTASGDQLEFVIHDGFAEVRDNLLTILTRSAEKPAEIDLERAKRAADRARERVRGQASLAEINLLRARAALRRALARSTYGRRS